MFSDKMQIFFLGIESIHFNVYVFSQYEYNLYSIESLTVSANQLAMCTCIFIAVLIYHDVIIEILPNISMWLDTHTGLKKMLSARYSVYYM